MENASKALIMAASVLLGVMILSIAVYLFYMYGQYSSSTYQKIDATQIEQFNQQFLRYYGETSHVETVVQNGKVKEVTITEPILATIHDIVSLAGLARQNNIDYEVNNSNLWGENNFYVRIDIGNKKQTINLEQKLEEDLLGLIKNSSGEKYRCTECKISNVTKRVYYMKFVIN